MSLRQTWRKGYFEVKDDEERDTTVHLMSLVMREFRYQGTHKK